MSQKIKIRRSASRPTKTTMKKIDLTEDILQERIEQAVQEVREKLSGTITDLEKQIRVLKKKNKVSKLSGDGGTPSKAIIKEAVEVAKQELLKEQKQLRKKLTRLEGARRSEELEKIRRRIIKEYDGQVIKGLIQGEDEDELRASAEDAHEAWVEAVKSAGVEVEEEEDDDDNVSSSDEDEDEDEEDDEEEVGSRAKKFKSPKSQPASNNRSYHQVGSLRLPAPNGFGGGHRNDPLRKLSGVRGLSPAEYRSNRANIMAALKQRVASTGGFIHQ